MTGSSRIPPSVPTSSSVVPSVAVPARGGIVDPVAAAAAARAVAREAAVIVLPEELRKILQEAEALSGRVVSVIAATGEARIRTERGDIVLKTEIPLPPQAEVVIERYRSGEPPLVRVMAAPPPETTEKTPVSVQAETPDAALLPPLKAGDVATAIFIPAHEAPVIPGTTEQASAPRTPLPPALEALKQLPAQTLLSLRERLPAEISLPETIMPLLQAPDLAAAFDMLPETAKEKIVTFFSLPAVKTLLEQTPAQKSISATTLQTQAPPGLHLPSEKTSSAAAPLAAFLTLMESAMRAPSSSAPFQQKVYPDIYLEAGKDIPRNLHRIRIVSVVPPEQNNTVPPAPAPAPPANTAVLTGRAGTPTPSGLPVIGTEMGDFILKTSSPLPQGSLVTFEAVPLTPVEIITQALQAVPPASVPRTGNEPFHPLASPVWPALQETMQILTEKNPEAAQALKNALPAAGPRLLPSTLFFMAALRMGNLESWIGDGALQTLRQAGRRDLAEKLGQEFGKISAQAKDSAASDWRTFSLPFLHDEQLGQIHLFTRQQRHDGEEEKDGATSEEKPTTRFILNLRLSRMGEMQIDGLLHKGQLDTILRTEALLPPSMRQEIAQRFHTVLAETGLQGGISFQTRAQAWALPETSKKQGLSVNTPVS